MKIEGKPPKGVPKGAKPVARITVYTVPKKGKDAGKQPGAAPRPTSRKR